MVYIPTPNSTCKICNTKYYSCKNCNNNFRWKNVTCSIDCFNIYISKINDKDGETTMDKSKKLNMVHPLRGMAYEDNQMHDFKDYEILSEQENWLLSTYKDRKYEINDMQYLYVPRITLIDIIKDIREDAYSKGYKDGKFSKRKSVKK